MKSYFRHTATILVLSAYIFLAGAGHLAVLANILNTGGPQQALASEEKSRPIDFRPVWIQRKHTASTSWIDWGVHLPPFTADAAVGVFRQCGALAVQDTRLLPQKNFQSFSSRAPPAV